MERQKYPLGEQSFKGIRTYDKLYIDKTDLVWQLVSGSKYYFLSRPRRFGKSLLVSTLEAYFLGQRELFKGLAIYSLTDRWEAYPVLHINLAATNTYSVERLGEILNLILARWESIYGAGLAEQGLSERFAGVIRRASEKTGKRVVVLVDEYDKPLLDTLHDKALNEQIRNVLGEFYANLKAMDEYIRFGLLTGVTRFSKVSIFSSLNNLDDITLDDRYATICGITHDELINKLRPGIHFLAEKLKVSEDEALVVLKENYDGYHFSEACPDIYNPFSLLTALDKSKIDHYWSSTGTPTFLVKMLKKHRVSLVSLQNDKTRELELRSTDLTADNPVALMYQTGYLTIKGYDPRSRRYILSYPNREVKEAFLNFLYPYYIAEHQRNSDFDILAFAEDVEAGDIDRFMGRLKALFAGYPYEALTTEKHPDGTFDCERHYHNVVYLIFMLMGYEPDMDVHCSTGVSDLGVKTPDCIYIFEFKYNRSSEEALRQIDEKGYADKYAVSKREVIKVGVNFSSEQRTISDWKIRSGTRFG